MKVSLYCKKKNKRADGKALIYYVLKLPGKRERLLSSKKYVDADYFDNQTNLVLKGSGNMQKYNFYFQEQVELLEGIILDIHNSKKTLTYDKVIEIYQSSNSFLEFADKQLKELNRIKKLEIEKNKKEGKKNKSYATLAQHEQSIRLLKEFRNDPFSFEEVDYDFLIEFKNFLTLIKGRQDAYHEMVTIRKFFNEARRKEITSYYPFSKINFEKEFAPPEADIEVLEEHEVLKLQELFFSNTLSKKLQKTLGNFLLTCETGIAGDDMRNPERLIINDISIRFIRGKTQRPVFVPLTNTAKKLIEFVKNNKLKQKAGRVNEDLREIMEKLSINKRITYHCGRDTFAVRGLRKGIHLRTIQLILGHASIKTTEKYMRVYNSLVTEEMQKMNLP